MFEHVASGFVELLVRSIRTVVFDAYGTPFDMYCVAACAEQLFAGKGEVPSVLWRDKQIDYTRIRSLAGPSGEHYKPFWDITVDALRYTAARLGVELSTHDEATLMRGYAYLPAFPENVPALRRLREMGLPLGILSSGNPQMLDTAMKSAGISGLFDHVLPADTVKLYKAASQAYALVPQAFGVPAEQTLFVSSNGWDAYSATWYGFATFWINRLRHPPEALDVAPTAAGHDMRDLLQFVQAT